MKDLLSKEHYCYKIQTPLTTSSAFLPFIDNPPPAPHPNGLPLHFYKKILPPSALL